MAWEEYDFDGVDPSQDVGGAPGHLPAPGPYKFNVKKWERRDSKSTQKPMVELVLEEQTKGVTIYDYFANLHDKGKPGYRRLHALFRLMGAKIQPGKPFKWNNEMATKLVLIATVRDEERDAVVDEETGDEKYEARTISRINRYLAVETVDGKRLTPAADAAAPTEKPAAKAKPEPEPEPAPVAAAATASEVDDSLWGEDE